MKSWMKRRPGESEEERLARVAHSCYRCGHYEPDLAALGQHEDTCDVPVPSDYHLQIVKAPRSRPPHPK